MENDPYKNFYLKGWEDAKTGKKSRVPQNYKLCYVSGRYDFFAGRQKRYES